MELHTAIDNAKSLENSFFTDAFHINLILMLYMPFFPPDIFYYQKSNQKMYFLITKGNIRSFIRVLKVQGKNEKFHNVLLIK